MAQPETPTPDPALRRLDQLVGKWELRGRTLEAKEDNIFGTSTFEWLPGGFFLKCAGETRVAGFHVHSLELIGYDAAADNFPAQVYSDLSGEIAPYVWDVQGDTVRHWTAAAVYTGHFSADGQTLSGGWRPTEGAPLEAGSSYDAVMTRVK